LSRQPRRMGRSNLARHAVAVPVLFLHYTPLAISDVHSRLARRTLMSVATVRRTGLTCLSLVVIALLVVLARVTASAPPPASTLEACINPGNGNMRLVGPGTACHTNETRVSWNVEGPVGPTGPTGPTGPQGADAGGPPFVWVCTPGNLDYSNNGNAEVSIFNGGSAPATLSTHFLAKNGANVSGGGVPPSKPGAPYPRGNGPNTASPARRNPLILPFPLGGGRARAGNP